MFQAEADTGDLNYIHALHTEVKEKKETLENRNWKDFPYLDQTFVLTETFFLLSICNQTIFLGVKLQLFS